MRRSTLITALSGLGLAAFTLLGTAHATESRELLIENYIGTINILTQGAEITVEGAKDGTVRTQKSQTTIDGNESIKSANCKKTKGNISLSIGKKSWRKRFGGYKDLDDYPVLDISVPSATTLTIRNSIVFGQGEDFAAVDAEIDSCGYFEVGDINGPLVLRVSGSGDFKAANVGTANVKVSGSGDVTLKDTRAAVLKVTGSGDISAETITGPAKLSTLGSGDIELEAIDGDLAYVGRGSSDLSVGRVDGPISLSLTGSGDVEIDAGNAPILIMSASGSSEIDFKGEAEDVTITSRGSSSITVETATGDIDIKRSGSGDIEINDQSYND